MRKIVVLLVTMGIAVCASARDFQVSWIDQMSVHIGKSIDGIPYNFTPIDDGYVYVKESKAGGFLGIGSRNVVEVLFANKKKTVEYGFWYMDSWLGSDETKELSDIRKELTEKYGAPVKNSQDTWLKKGGGLFGKDYEIGIYRDSSDGSACVLVQKQKSGFEKRWKLLLNSLGIK